ncbi:M20/M25/M40 family metallo-hydrolase [Methanoculleus chikugoensis]|uniref:M20/M25/M40 family metallo-hydrolase n=1 Tax=Methanoculleus chikugoensis TaxID=118126 RepID=UPI000B2F25C6|nr:M20/M25/M40 family metallo-hydrolase [Methanoculleus chikugoensis]
MIRETDVAEPTLTPPDARIVRTVSREVERVYGTVTPFLQWAASDAKYLRDVGGFDVVEYGPGGEIPTLHAVDERVSLEQLEKAVDVYRGGYPGVLGVTPPPTDAAHPDPNPAAPPNPPSSRLDPVEEAVGS